MDVKLSQTGIALARAASGGTRSPPGREPEHVEVAAEALREAVASRRAARTAGVAAGCAPKEAS